jgi:hypothetical protein
MIYDNDTEQFMKVSMGTMDASDGPLNKPSVSTAVGALPQELPENQPTRDPYPRPTAPQSIDNQQGSIPSGASGIPYPSSTKLGEDPKPSDPYDLTPKDYLKAVVKIQGGGNPVSVLAKTIAKRGVKALIGNEEQQKMAEDGKPLLGPLSLYRSLGIMYGKDWYNWELETIIQTVRLDHKIDLESYGNVDELWDMIGALQVVLNTNFAHEQWHVFEKVGQAFNYSHVDFDVVQPLEIHETAVTLKIIDRLRPKTDYTHEIIGYIAASAKHSGFVYLPETLFPSGCQEALDALGNDTTLKMAVEHSWKNKVAGHTEAEILQLSRLNELVSYVDQLGGRQ